MEEQFEVIKAEDAAVMARLNPARRRVLLAALKYIDRYIRSCAERGYRSGECTVNLDGFDLKDAIMENLSGYSVWFKDLDNNKVEVNLKW